MLDLWRRSGGHAAAVDCPVQSHTAAQREPRTPRQLRTQQHGSELIHRTALCRAVSAAAAYLPDIAAGSRLRPTPMNDRSPRPASDPCSTPRRYAPFTADCSERGATGVAGTATLLLRDRFNGDGLRDNADSAAKKGLRSPTARAGVLTARCCVGAAPAAAQCCSVTLTRAVSRSGLKAQRALLLDWLQLPN